jgi:hypothetical protein
VLTGKIETINMHPCIIKKGGNEMTTDMKRNRHSYLPIFLCLFLLLHNLSSSRASQEILHQSDLVITDDQTFVIENCQYSQIGNVIVQDQATLILSNATFSLVQNYDNHYRIDLANTGRIIAYETKITSDHSFNIRAYDQTSLYLSDCDLPESEIVGIWDSKITALNSTIGWIRCQDMSEASLERCSLEMGCQGEGQIRIVNSTLHNLLLYPRSSEVTFYDLNPRIVRYWDFQENCSVARGGMDIRLLNTTVEHWSVGVATSSSVSVRDSTIRTIGLTFEQNSNLTLHDLPRGHVASWGLYKDNVVSKALINLTLVDVFIEGGWGLECTDSTLQIEAIRADSTAIYMLGVYGQSSVHILDSQYNYVSCWGSSSLSTENCTFWWGISCFEYSSVRMANTTVGTLTCYENASIVTEDSEWYSLKALSNSVVHIIDPDADLLAKCEVSDNANIEVSWHLTLFVTDGGVPVKGAMLRIYTLNDALVAVANTDSSGSAVLTLTERIIRSQQNPQGTEYVGNYVVEAVYRWHSWRKQVKIDSSKHLVMVAPSCYLAPTFTDAGGENLKGLSVELIDPYGGLVGVNDTDLTGQVMYDNLLPGNYTLHANWLGMCVYNRGIPLIENTTVPTIQVCVYDVRIIVLNEESHPISNMVVTLKWPNGTKIDSQTTNNEGYARFEDLPSATYLAEVSPPFSIPPFRCDIHTFLLANQDQQEPIVLTPILPLPTIVALLAIIVSCSICASVGYYAGGHIKKLGRFALLGECLLGVTVILCIFLVYLVFELRRAGQIEALAIATSAFILFVLYEILKHLGKKAKKSAQDLGKMRLQFTQKKGQVEQCVSMNS